MKSSLQAIIAAISRRRRGRRAELSFSVMSEFVIEYDYSCRYVTDGDLICPPKRMTFSVKLTSNEMACQTLADLVILCRMS